METPAINRPPLALQLWSVRDDCQRDFAATVAAVAGIGYPAVELAGFGNLDTANARLALDDAGLRVAGMHVSLPLLQREPNQVIDQALTMGTSHVVCPHWPESHFVGAAACRQIGEQLDAIGARLRPFGLQLSFHNHAAEAKIVSGQSVFEWILGAAAPENLTAEPDVYWLHVGGYAPEKFLRRHGGRCPLIHLKDEKGIGDGPVDFGPVFAAADAIGVVEYFVVEQERYDQPPLESARRNLDQLRRWNRA